MLSAYTTAHDQQPSHHGRRRAKGWPYPAHKLMKRHTRMPACTFVVSMDVLLAPFSPCPAPVGPVSPVHNPFANINLVHVFVPILLPNDVSSATWLSPGALHTEIRLFGGSHLVSLV